MQLLYVGFEQRQNVREYIFHGVTYGEETRVFVVTTEMSMFRDFHIGLQEGPVLCLRTLAAEMESLGSARLPPIHRTSERDVRAYLVDRSMPPPKANAKRPRPKDAHL
jgi:hypothetical protein